MLASLIIEEARKLEDISVGFFYFANGDPERAKFVSMARAILSQLLAQDDSILLHIEDKMSTSGGQAILSSSALAQDLLQTTLKSRTTYIILDGIDECKRDHRKEICSWFRSVVDSLPRTKHDEIRCLFISQDDGIARKDLSMLPTISVSPDDNRADIATFARQWQDRIEERFGSLRDHGIDVSKVVTAKSQGELQQKVILYLCQGARSANVEMHLTGMFIFAKCFLEELYQQPSKEALLREWRTECLPTELQEMYASTFPSFPTSEIGVSNVSAFSYDRILRRLMDDHVEQRRHITRKLLSWISLSKRPLRWYEIQAAISIDLDNETINEEHRRLVDTSKDLCASFVEVYPDQTVALVHSTVRE